MESLNIAVPKAAKEFIERQVADRGVANADAYILALVEKVRLRHIREEVETKLLKGLASPSSLMDDTDWDEIRETGEQLLATPSRHIIEDRGSRLV